MRDRCTLNGRATCATNASITASRFFFKQWGEWAPSTHEHAEGNPRAGWQSIKAHPTVARFADLLPENGAAFVERVGKKAAGRLLDGVTHDGYPQVVSNG